MANILEFRRTKPTTVPDSNCSLDQMLALIDNAKIGGVIPGMTFTLPHVAYVWYDIIFVSGYTPSDAARTDLAYGVLDITDTALTLEAEGLESSDFMIGISSIMGVIVGYELVECICMFREDQRAVELSYYIKIQKDLHACISIHVDMDIGIGT